MMSDHGPWPIESIPNENDLFYRVDRQSMPPHDLSVHSGVFRENRGSLSCDWEKYSTAEQTRARTGKPKIFGVIRMNTGKIRSISGLTVTHDPDYPNRNQAHTAVEGLGPQGNLSPQERAKRNGYRLAMYELFSTWEISPDQPPPD